jgi:ABC-type transport system involved in cytochrome c biogenesis ATPase subunit
MQHLRVTWWLRLQGLEVLVLRCPWVQASSTNGAGSSTQLRLVATVTQAGSYALSVAVTDPATNAVRHIPARGSPDTVMVGLCCYFVGWCICYLC